MSNLSDENLIQEFVIESRDHLSSIEPDLLLLEKQGKDAGQEVINRVFRAIHSIKGAAGFFGFEMLKSLSHIMESVLMAIRDGKMDPTPGVMEALLTGVDKLRAMMDDIHASDQVQCDTEIKTFESILKNNGDPTPGEVVSVQTTGEDDAEQGTFRADRDLVEAAVRHGQKLFLIETLLDTDFTAKNRTPLDMLDILTTTGVVLDTLVDVHAFPDLSQCLDSSMSFKILFASVLDLELVEAAIDVPAKQIKLVDVDEVLPKKKGKGKKKAAPAAKEEPKEKPTTAESTPSEPAEPAPTAEKPKPAAASPSSEPAQKKPSAAVAEATNETVRVRVDLLNKLMDLAGEMVLSRNQLRRTLLKDMNKINGLATIVQNIDLITSDLQEHIMQTRMQPIGSVFGKFPRIVRDLARQLDKEIELEMSGEDVELDKSIIESLSDPLTHLIRNSCDHAIEEPDDRLEAGKTSKGTIWLKAYHEGGQINIAIKDDGRGIDHEKVGKKALENGIVSEADLKKMSHQEIVNLIWMPGFSTAEKITDFSGRGVGMDVVRTNIEKLGGTISIETAVGKGTTMLLRLPLTLAIIPSLIVGVSDQRFAIPQINLVELVRVRAEEISSKIEKVGTAPVLRLRGKLLPLVRLSDVLEIERGFINPITGEAEPERRLEVADQRQSGDFENPDTPPIGGENRRRTSDSDYNIMVLKVASNHYGLIVDELFDTEEIVVKPLSGYLKNCKCFAGATIMGDGRVAMILDAGGILAFSKLSFASVDEDHHTPDHREESSEEGDKKAFILFNNHPSEVFAVPLDSILRLEKFDPQKLEYIAGKEFLTYRGKGLPLVRIEHYLPVRACADDLTESYLIIPKASNGEAGIVASRILDTIEIEVKLDTKHSHQPGIQGSAVVGEHLTMFIDPEGLLNTAGLNSDTLQEGADLYV